MIRRARVACFVMACCSVAPPVRAEWTVSGYLGASFTRPNTLVLTERFSDGRSRDTVTWTDVPYASRSFKSPPYYGYRVTWFPHRSSHLGIAAELTHLKLYAPSDLAEQPILTRFSISHGLNLLTGNVVWRHDLLARVHITARAGVGIAIPHGESTVRGDDQEQYEVSGLALHGAVGPEFVLSRRLRAFAEYKLTTAAPSVSVAGGTIRGRYTSQHIAAGLGIAW
jgi:lipid A oxidase